MIEELRPRRFLFHTKNNALKNDLLTWIISFTTRRVCNELV
jgi:hypothetical protein